MIILSTVKFDAPQLETIKGTQIVYFDGDSNNYKDIGAKVDGIICRRKMVTRDFMEVFCNIKWIGLLSSGYDRIPVDLIKERGITLTNARGVNSIPIAEDVVCKMLLVSRNYKKYYENQNNGLWEYVPGMVEINQKTVAILGTGSIGREIAKRLKSFNMHIIGFNRSPVKNDLFDEMYLNREDLKQILSKSDFVIVCLPLNEETKHFINKTTLSYMKPDAVLINTARGGLVNETDLMEALANKTIKAAAIDVVETEPLDPDSPLWEIDNLMITPHQSYKGDLTDKRIEEMVFENIKLFVSGQRLNNVVTL